MGRPSRPPNQRRRLIWISVGVACLLPLIVAFGLVLAAWHMDDILKGSRASVPPDAFAALEGVRGDEPIALIIIGDDARQGTPRGNADSVLVLRFGGGEPTTSLAISRDVVLAEPRGADRVASIYSQRGAAALIRAVSHTLVLPLNHVAIVRFADVRELVDDLGGVRVRNPRAFTTEPFDGGRWRFAAGEVDLSGRRALAYARARTPVDPGANEATNGDASVSVETNDDLATGETERLERQQRVLAAIARSFTFGDVVRHPFARTRLVARSAATSLSVATAISAARSLGDGIDVRCRLGGRKQLVRAGTQIPGTTAVPRRDGLLLVATNDEVRALIRMATGDAPPGVILAGDYPTGCKR